MALCIGVAWMQQSNPLVTTVAPVSQSNAHFDGLRCLTLTSIKDVAEGSRNHEGTDCWISSIEADNKLTDFDRFRDHFGQERAVEISIHYLPSLRLDKGRETCLNHFGVTEARYGLRQCVALHALTCHVTCITHTRTHMHESQLKLLKPRHSECDSSDSGQPSKRSYLQQTSYPQ